MALEVRTYDEMYELGRSLFRNYITDADVSVGSDYEITARILAVLFVGNQGQAEYLADQIFPSTAEGEFLDRHAEAVGGRLPAAKSTLVLMVTASSGVDTQASGSGLTHVGGTTFVTTAPVTMALPAWGTRTVVTGSNKYRMILSPNVTGIAVDDLITVNAEVRAIQAVDSTTGVIDLYEPLSADPSSGDTVTATRGGVVAAEAVAVGPDGNKLQGDVMDLDSPTGTIDAEVRVISSSGGANQEEDEDLQARVTDHDENPPASGNAAHYRSAARTVTEHRVADAAVYPGYRGYGTVDVIPMGPAFARFPTPQMITAVDDAVQAIAPYVDDVLTLQPSLSAYVEVTITVEVETGWEPDFITASGYAVQGTSTTVRLDLGSSPVGVIEIGDRILYSARFGGVWQVYEREVTGVDASGIDIGVALPFTPSVNPDGRNDVFSSGPNGPEIVAAIEAVYDALGPGIGGSGGGATYEREPKPATGLDPVLRESDLGCACAAVTGVRSVTVDTIDDLSPADIIPAPQTIVRQGQITVILEEP